MPSNRTEPIYHLADATEWEQALAAGVYRRSTLGASIDEVGFMHASTAAQWPVTRARFYARHDAPLVLLTIDPDLLDVPVVYEVGDEATGERFPHLYAPLPVSAVVATRRLDPPHAHPGN